MYSRKLSRPQKFKPQPDMGNIQVTTSTKIFPNVLRYKNGRRTAIQTWEAHCDTNNGRSAEVFLFPESSVAPKALQYKLEAYCDRNWRCIAICFLRSSGGWGFRHSFDDSSVGAEKRLHRPKNLWRNSFSEILHIFSYLPLIRIDF